MIASTGLLAERVRMKDQKKKKKLKEVFKPAAGAMGSCSDLPFGD